MRFVERNYSRGNRWILSLSKAKFKNKIEANRRRVVCMKTYSMIDECNVRLQIYQMVINTENKLEMSLWIEKERKKKKEPTSKQNMNAKKTKSNSKWNKSKQTRTNEVMCIKMYWNANWMFGRSIEIDALHKFYDFGCDDEKKTGRTIQCVCEWMNEWMRDLEMVVCCLRLN